MELQQGPAARRVALVIGAGAIKCAAALGLWKVLQREGIELDMLVGCSGGSMYAAAMASGEDLDTCIELTQSLWTRKVTESYDYRSLLGAFLPALFHFDGRMGMLSDRELNRALERPFGGRRFEDTKIPLFIATTDLMTGEKVVLTEGSIFDAVRASIALPYIWRPWKVGERWLLDGCVSNPLPIDVAMREGAHIILAMGFESAYPRRLKSASRYAFQINSIYTNHLLRGNFAFHNLAHHTEVIPVIPEFERGIGLFDTDQFPYVIEQGERAMEAQLPYVQRLLEELKV